MKKKIVIVSIVVILIVLGLYLNVVINKNKIEKATYSYIESRGYLSEAIKEINIEHSYINKLLGYNEWRISVIFKENDNYSVWLSYRNNEIFLEGLTGDYGTDKEEYIKRYEEFKNGTLFNEYKIQNIK